MTNRHGESQEGDPERLTPDEVGERPDEETLPGPSPEQSPERVLKTGALRSMALEAGLA